MGQNIQKTNIIVLAILLLIVGLFSGCSNVSDEDLIKAREAVKNGALIVDVRTPEGFSRLRLSRGNIDLQF